VIALRTRVPTTAGARGGTIPTQVGALHPRGGAGGIRSGQMRAEHLTDLGSRSAPQPRSRPSRCYWGGEELPRARHQTDLSGVDRYDAGVLSTFRMDEGRVMKTAADRATEVIEAAEKMFADELGVVLDLSPAAKTALIVKIAAAIRAAVAEEREAHIRGMTLRPCRA
jgi:hypothetical protein